MTYFKEHKISYTLQEFGHSGDMGFKDMGHTISVIFSEFAKIFQ